MRLPKIIDGSCSLDIESINNVLDAVEAGNSMDGVSIIIRRHFKQLSPVAYLTDNLQESTIMN